MYQPLAHPRYVPMRFLQQLPLAFVFVCVTGGASPHLVYLCSTKPALWCYYTHITYAASRSSAAANVYAVDVGATLSGEVFCIVTTDFITSPCRPANPSPRVLNEPTFDQIGQGIHRKTQRCWRTIHIPSWTYRLRLTGS